MRCAPFDSLLGISSRKNIIRLGRKTDPGPSSRRTRQTRVADGLKRKARTCLLLFLSVTTSAQADNTVNEPHFDFDIPRQRAALALTKFAEQANLTLIVPHELLEGKISNELIGRYSLQEGIDILLDGTGLDPVISNHVVLSITAEAPADPGGTMKAKKKVGLLAVLASVFASGASAQNASNTSAEEQEPRPLEEIVVTGTNIQGVSNETSPTITFDREAIDKSGFGNVQDLLSSLPQNEGGVGSQEEFNFGADRAATNNVGAGAGLNLRGLGGGSTLVLLNGRRVSPAGSGTAVDISLIALSAIDRVEVILDGASSIYGSDAVGGVVNFIMRDDFDGVEAGVRYETVTRGNHDRLTASATFGGSWGSGNGLISYEYYDQSNLGLEDRDFGGNVALPADVLPAQQRHSVLATVSQKVLDEVRMFADLTYSDSDVERFSGSPQFAESNFTKTPTDQLNISAGAEAILPSDWRLQLTGLYSSNERSLFSSSVGTQADFPNITEFETWSSSIVLDGGLLSLPAGEVRLAVGGEYRDESLNEVSGMEQTRTEISRDVNSAFGELYIPLVSEANAIFGVRRFEVRASARFDDYSDAGSSTSPKVGVLWSPFSNLKLRASWGEAFRAPFFDDLSTLNNNDVLFNLADPVAFDGFTLGLFRNGGNPDLRPETSEIFTAGFDYTPLQIEGLTLGFGYYGIEYKDRIAITPVSAIFASVTEAATLFPDAIFLNPDSAAVSDVIDNSRLFQNFFGPFDPADVEAIIDVRLVNQAVQKVSGLDFNIGYGFSTSYFDVDFYLNADYILENEIAGSAVSPVTEVVNTAFNPVDLTIRGSASLSRGAFSGTIFVNLVDSYTNNIVTPNESIDSWTTIDANLRYDFSGQSSAHMLDGIVYSLSVQNLFDEDPPFVASPTLRQGASYDPTNASAVGRLVAFHVIKKF